MTFVEIHTSNVQISNKMWISIEGNIGSGKTTAFEALQKLQLEWIFANEPVQEWVAAKEALGNRSMLQVF